MHTPETFWQLVRREETPCWTWMGSIDRGGYGRIGYRGKNTRAHRLAYALVKGPIPEGLELDHLCRNRTCVNPDHLEPVTHQVNAARAARNEYKRSITHCRNGHEYTPENTHWYRGDRYCRSCQRAAWRRHDERRRLGLTLAEYRARKAA